MPSTVAKRLGVVAGIIRDEHGRVLLAQRPAHKHQGGCWEFPGGKIQRAETASVALARELAEELDIRVLASQPFMTIDHDYPDLSVRLYFREVTRWQGQPCGMEGQPLGWCSPSDMSVLPFPAANVPVVRALTLSSYLLITPTPLPPDWLQSCLSQQALVPLVYLRRPSAEVSAADVTCLQARGMRVLVNEQRLVQSLGADGLHLGAQALMCLGERPQVPLLSAACHNEAELGKAIALGVDLALLSPVKTTASHPHASPLGWDAFRALAQGLPLPVYALGGLQPDDLPMAREMGARGVAGIRGFARWQSS